MREYRRLLAGIPVELLAPADVGVDVEVEEVGATFEENAALKAKAIASLSGIMSLADDSGLEVDALGGEPGVRSARYAGEGASDEDRVSYLLSKMRGVPWEERTARFCCVIAVASPEGAVEFCEGKCEGMIALQPKGEGGFGYDPVFYVPALDRTMAELSQAEKNAISHRGRAAGGVPRVLERLGYDRP